MKYMYMYMSCISIVLSYSFGKTKHASVLQSFYVLFYSYGGSAVVI